MSNPYYTASGIPGTGSAGASAPVRSEFAAIQTGFGLLPLLAGNANALVTVNSTATALTVSGGSFVLGGAFSTGSTFTTVGAFSTGGAFTTVGTFSTAGAFSTTGAYSITLTASASVTLTLPAVNGTLATLAGTETLSNKTLVAPALGTPASGVLTNTTGLPISTGLAGAGVGVLTALAAGVTGTGDLALASGATLTAPALGTPASGVLTNVTGLPISTGLTGAGVGVLGALAAGVTGTGALALAGGPTFTGAVVVPNATTATEAVALGQSLAGATVHDVTASRASGVVYTNSNARPIVAYVRGETTAANGVYSVYIAGVAVAQDEKYAINTPLYVVVFVPPGATYEVLANSANFLAWIEIS